MTDFSIKGDEVRHGKQLYLSALSQAVVDSFSDKLLSETLLYHLNDGTSGLEPHSAKVIAGKIKIGEGLKFALCYQLNQQSIGVAQLADIQWQARHAQLTISILDEFYLTVEMLTDAIQTVLQFAYWEANLNRIGVLCLEDNSLLREALENTGFTKEGQLRQETYRNGHYLDIEMYSILAREWSAT